jgi:hypothetical protein
LIAVKDLQTVQQSDCNKNLVLALMSVLWFSVPFREAFGHQQSAISVER